MSLGETVAKSLIGFAMMLDVDDGDGWRETIIALVLIIGTFIMMFLDKEIPTWLVGTMGVVTGAYFGSKITKHTTE